MSALDRSLDGGVCLSTFDSSGVSLILPSPSKLGLLELPWPSPTVEFDGSIRIVLFSCCIFICPYLTFWSVSLLIV